MSLSPALYKRKEMRHWMREVENSTTTRRRRADEISLTAYGEEVIPMAISRSM